MKIVYLRLKNFRQFYGEQEIEFAPSNSPRNVTVVHGFNGSGKTALLNAFIWCLYGKTTPDLEAPERMVNETVAANLGPDEQCEVMCELRFLGHKDEIYVANRTAVVQKSADGKITQALPDFSLGCHRANGEYENMKGAAQLYINQHLPEELYPFFFFNGERVEKLASMDAYDQVEGGIKTLLNVRIFERSVKDLGHVICELERELRQYGSDELKKGLVQKAELESERQELEDQIRVSLQNVATCDEEIELIDQKQVSIVDLSALVERRRHLETQVLNDHAIITDTENELKETVSRNGFLAFADGPLTTMQTIVADARQKGELPAKLKPQFVEDLLDERVCICGRSIEDGSDEEKKLLEWKEATGLAVLEEAILQTSAAIPPLLQRRSDYFVKLDHLRNKQNLQRAALRNHQDELAQTKSDIGDRSLDEEAESLEQQRAKATSDRDRSKEILAETNRKLEKLDNLITDVIQENKRWKVENEKGKLINRQLDAVQNVAQALNQICDIQKQDVRTVLDRQVAEIWTDAAVKDYTASISEGFRLELFKNVGGVRRKVLGASTGEKQVLALSFVSALVRKAADNAAEVTETNVPLMVGGEYPLVMDSPFGSLEHEYQRKVAEWIPTLAGQVVMIASKSQWTNQVEDAVRKRVGKEYILELHTSKEGVEQEIEICGNLHAYVKNTGAETEETVIREVL